MSEDRSSSAIRRFWEVGKFRSERDFFLFVWGLIAGIIYGIMVSVIWVRCS